MRRLCSLIHDTVRFISLSSPKSTKLISVKLNHPLAQSILHVDDVVLLTECLLDRYDTHSILSSSPASELIVLSPAHQQTYRSFPLLPLSIPFPAVETESLVTSTYQGRVLSQSSSSCCLMDQSILLISNCFSLTNLLPGDTILLQNVHLIAKPFCNRGSSYRIILACCVSSVSPLLSYH